jgi:hypothetical protein
LTVICKLAAECAARAVGFFASLVTATFFPKKKSTV